jgi:hypothetical protein
MCWTFRCPWACPWPTPPPCGWQCLTRTGALWFPPDCLPTAASTNPVEWVGVGLLGGVGVLRAQVWVQECAGGGGSGLPYTHIQLGWGRLRCLLSLPPDFVSYAQCWRRCRLAGLCGDRCGDSGMCLVERCGGAAAGGHSAPLPWLCQCACGYLLHVCRVPAVFCDLVVLGCAWMCLAVLGCAWLCLAVLGCAWLCVTVLGRAWLCLAVLGCAWLCVTVLGHAWLQVRRSVAGPMRLELSGSPSGSLLLQVTTHELLTAAGCLFTTKVLPDVICTRDKKAGCVVLRCLALTPALRGSTPCVAVPPMQRRGLAPCVPWLRGCVGSESHRCWGWVWLLPSPPVAWPGRCSWRCTAWDSTTVALRKP